jgi:hypothetical protein
MKTENTEAFSGKFQFAITSFRRGMRRKQNATIALL